MPKTIKEPDGLKGMIESNNPVLLILRLEREGRITKQEGTRELMAYLEEIGTLRWGDEVKCQRQREI